MPEYIHVLPEPNSEWVMPRVPRTLDTALGISEVFAANFVMNFLQFLYTYISKIIPEFMGPFQTRGSPTRVGRWDAL